MADLSFTQMSVVAADNGMEKNFYHHRGARNRNFTHKENVELIRIWGASQLQRKFENSYRNSRLWETIAEQMQEAGFNRSHLECKTRVANLKAQFFKLKRSIQPGSSPPDWPYYNMLRYIIDGNCMPPQLTQLAQQTPAAVADSMESVDCSEDFEQTPNGSSFNPLNFPNASTVDSSSHDSYLDTERYQNNGMLAEMGGDRSNPRSGRNRNFTHEETVELLEIWGDEAVQRKFESSYRNSCLWEYITKRMQKAGFQRSLIECKTRIANLKCQYYKLKRQTQTGATPDWPYWDILHNIIEGRGMQNLAHMFNENMESPGQQSTEFGEEYDFSRLNGNSENGTSFPGLNYPPSFVLDSSSHHSDLDDDSTASDAGDGEFGGALHIDLNPCSQNEDAPRRRSKRKLDELVMHKLLDIERRSLSLQEERNEDERKMFKAVADFFNAMTSLITGDGVNPPPSNSNTTLSETMLSLVTSLHSAQQKLAAANQTRQGGAKPDLLTTTTTRNNANNSSKKEKVEECS